MCALAKPGFDSHAIRADFPILARKIHGRTLVYLDSAASAQKPRCVIDAVAEFYERDYANVHRGLHYLSNNATERYEEARGKIAHFLNAAQAEEILLTRGTTEAINLAAYGWLLPRIRAGDEILLSVLEHHSNIVPWHFLRVRHGAVLRWLAPDESGVIAPAMVAQAITARTRLLALTHMSNVTGAVLDMGAICREAKERGVPVLVDGSQAAVHGPVDVQAMGCDFYAITGHKLYGPSGSGALYARRARQEEMQPWQGGGNMVGEVTRETITYARPPHRFEAGTPPIAQIVGFGAAIDYVGSLGMGAIAAHERHLRDYARVRLADVEGLRLFHDAGKESGAIFSFTLEGLHPHDISTIIDRKGVAVRAGHHCAQPLMRYLGVNATCRASLALYNSREDVDALARALDDARRLVA